MRSPAVVAEPGEAERVRRSLRKLGVLRTDLRALRMGGLVYFPVTAVPEGYRGAEADFPEVRRIPPFSLPFDVVGDIAILRHPTEDEDLLLREAERILNAVPRVRLVLLDEGVRGPMRLHSYRILAGEGPMTTVHRENGITLYLELDRVYFSPRLSYERARVASQVSEGEEVFDMFAGAGPFTILMAKRGARVHACDINPWAARLILRNSALNGVSGDVRVLNMDAASASELVGTVDRVVMNLPLGARRFLWAADRALRTGGVVHLYTIEGRGERMDVPGNYRILLRRVVHSYSPGRSVVVYDMQKIR